MENHPEQPSFNVVILRGVLSSPPTVRDLPSGTRLCQLEVTTRVDEKALTVPVVQFDALGATENLAAGADIVVTGSVKRRFYRAGGQTQSRTEVVADKILPATATKRVEKAIATATERCAIVT